MTEEETKGALLYTYMQDMRLHSLIGFNFIFTIALQIDISIPISKDQ